MCLYVSRRNQILLVLDIVVNRPIYYIDGSSSNLLVDCMIEKFLRTKKKKIHFEPIFEALRSTPTFELRDTLV